MKINAGLLPLKAHFFFFMAAMGPVLPFLPVIGKQLGISEVVMGVISSIFPIAFLVSKPIFGFVLDLFQNARKVIFLILLCSTNLFFVLLAFIPVNENALDINEICSALLVCSNQSTPINFSGSKCYSICNQLSKERQEYLQSVNKTNCQISCKVYVDPEVSGAGDYSLYSSFSFWSYVILMSLGSIGFNVLNSVSDTVCFDVLGKGNEKGYGNQRVWGTFGFGISALLGGFAIDIISKNSTYKNYSPALFLAFGCMMFDLLICCLKLKFPPLPKSANILRDVGLLIKQPHIVIFLCFTVMAGVCDSFIIYYLFWFLEDLAKESDMMDNIKLLEGITVAVETLGSEILFFLYSGKIIEFIGYGHCLSLCFLAYAIRLGLLSLLTNPWWVLPIEFLMQGPSYALSYSTIVAYAGAISPPGTSATTQGLVAGLDDGLGYALGSLSCGFLYRSLGGNNTLKVYSGLALACSILHFILYHFVKRPPKADTEKSIQYQNPRLAVETLTIAS